ncbi:MAG: hypothetical protein JNK05_36940 [Myxococcales bacterium]|nr:hypothetical protein [Myxococcales bacterium]
MRRSIDGSSVTVEFDGRLDALGGQQSASALATELEASPRDVVWDVRRMSGYDTEARVAWQKTLWPLRDKIRSVRVIGGGPLIRVGALTLAGLLGVAISFDES